MPKYYRQASVQPETWYRLCPFLCNNETWALGDYFLKSKFWDFPGGLLAKAPLLMQGAGVPVPGQAT